eukprot:Polyplicarium_translucidae@DN3360_c0_g3_i11.p1
MSRRRLRFGLLLLLAGRARARYVNVEEDLNEACRAKCASMEMVWSDIAVHVPYVESMPLPKSQALFSCSCTTDTSRASDWALVSLTKRLRDACGDAQFRMTVPPPGSVQYKCAEHEDPEIPMFAPPLDPQSLKNRVYDQF